MGNIFLKKFHYYQLDVRGFSVPVVFRNTCDSLQRCEHFGFVFECFAAGHVRDLPFDRDFGVCGEIESLKHLSESTRAEKGGYRVLVT